MLDLKLFYYIMNISAPVHLAEFNCLTLFPRSKLNTKLNEAHLFKYCTYVFVRGLISFSLLALLSHLCSINHITALWRGPPLTLTPVLLHYMHFYY